MTLKIIVNPATVTIPDLGATLTFDKYIPNQVENIIKRLQQNDIKNEVLQLKEKEIPAQCPKELQAKNNSTVKTDENDILPLYRKLSACAPE